MTFTEEELEGCTDFRLEEWFASREELIFTIAGNHDEPKMLQLDSGVLRRLIIRLCIAAYELKKCPYA